MQERVRGQAEDAFVMLKMRLGGAEVVQWHKTSFRPGWCR
jgi:hypothetical protein